VTINLQIDDLANENLELYDHKGINIEPTTFNEKVVDNHEAYVESLHLQKYFKIQPVKKTEPKFTDKKEKPKKLMIQEKPTKEGPKESKRRTEDEIYEKFEKDMEEMMAKVTNYIALFFLFAQGLLAGISLTNIFLLFEFATFAEFTTFYSLFAREIFDFSYVFTFTSLIGNGVKFLNSYKKYSQRSGIFGEQDQIAKLKKTMVYSCIIFILYMCSFFLQMYLIKYIPILYFIKYQNNTNNITALLSTNDFYIYGALSLAVSIISLLGFVVNILDVERVEHATDSDSHKNKANTHSDLDDTRETTNIITI